MVNPTSPIFLTDDEFESLFGADVARAVRLLSKHATNVCRQCAGECCRRIGCEFYSERFHSCPIHAYRPAKCRLYHCDRILDNESLTGAERRLLNRPAVEVSRHLRQNWGLHIFIEPPLTVGNESWLSHLGLSEEVSTIMRELSEGKVSPELASAKLKGIVERHREERQKNGCRRLHHTT